MATNYEDWKKEEYEFEIPFDQPSLDHFTKCRDKIERYDLCRNKNHNIRIDNSYIPTAYMFIKCGRPQQMVHKCWKDVDEGL